ncbi:uncharacterized protein N7511_009317 [Penicillium nucicola]|uniref:uncharacterized protein n=1 Tax=Penicillium nucicola TaxID=1850975 RepID=UPI002544E176|nr:uncharacterized protein N7511_009317 [Penicillium nucicola]KAJ5747621.1 hypothetical protein N7511_009317 [Penicillium nucicola]
MGYVNLKYLLLCGLFFIATTVFGVIQPVPAQGAGGICYMYIIQGADTCFSIAQQHSITVADIEAFNKNTWAWLGCKKSLYQGAFICLSAGAAPMPVALPQATCGPQVPGTTRPKNFDLLGTLNPCPEKGCCSPWGVCGTTPEFCSPSDYTSHTTAAPTQAQKGTAGQKAPPPAETTKATRSESTTTKKPRTTTTTSKATTSKSTSTKTMATTKEADKTTKASASTETAMEPWTLTLYEKKNCEGNYYLLEGYNKGYDQMNPARCLNVNGNLKTDSMGTDTFCKFFTEEGLHSTSCDAGNFTKMASWYLKNGFCYTFNLKDCSYKDHKDSFIGDGSNAFGCENHGPRHSPNYDSLNCFVN